MRKSLNSLRTKVLGALTVALCVLFLAQYVITKAVLTEGFAHLDTERAKHNLTLVRSVIEQQLSQLRGITADYAHWDEMIDFSKNRSVKFLDENFGPLTFNNLKINTVIILNQAGTPLFTREVDLEARKILPEPHRVLQQILDDPKLVRHSNSLSQTAGILNTPNGPVLIVSSPILDSNGEGPVFGTLMMLRYIDQKLLDPIAKNEKFTVTTQPVTDNLAPADEMLVAHLKTLPFYIDNINQELMKGSALFNDIYDRPALIYSVSSERAVYAQVRVSSGYLFWSSLAIFLILGLISLLFDYLVVRRITQLTKHIRNVGSTKEGVFERLPLSGMHDELATLTDSMNNMLMRIEMGIAERKRAEDRIYLMAHYDQLTKLPNRVLLNKIINDAIAAAKNSLSQFAVLFMDLDRFKNVNDSLGHDAGDELLVVVADRLRSFIRGRAKISRLGGDEFVVVLPDLIHATQAEEFAARLVTALNRVCVIRGQEINVSTSIGISIYPNDGDDIDALLRNADTAMYRAKDRGRNSYVTYSKHMNMLAIERLQLEVNLRHAVERNELTVSYQPVADLVSNQIISAEALLRWQHPTYGFIPPAKFIPVAEEAGLIQIVGDWVFRAVCKQLREWMNENIATVPIAVNISAKQLQTKNFCANIEKVMRDYGISPGLIVFELTESTVMSDDNELTTMLEQIQKLGIRIAIDDFGTGYSSFSRLHQCPIDILKIDQSFTRRIDDDVNNSTSIIKAMINMAKALKIRVVAEGVETDQQHAFLRDNECDAVQGYWVSRSLSTQEFGVQLQKQVVQGQGAHIPKPRTQPVSILNGNGNNPGYAQGVPEFGSLVAAI
ncbi:MAG: EAL domain-containing protein [Anaerolineae bacterium]|nr:EAL domain-containing protein [Anaerolineae bacterium]